MFFLIVDVIIVVVLLILLVLIVKVGIYNNIAIAFSIPSFVFIVAKFTGKIII